MLNQDIKPPFIADVRAGIVRNADLFHLADVRGIGKSLDFNLQYIVDALNEKAKKDAAVDVELEWLRWFRNKAQECLGPASADIIESLKSEYIYLGKKLPKAEQSEEG